MNYKQVWISILVCFVFIITYFDQEYKTFNQNSYATELTNLTILNSGKTSNDNTYFTARLGKNKVNLMNLDNPQIGDNISVRGYFLNQPSNYNLSSYFLGYFWVTDYATYENKQLNFIDSLENYRLDFKKSINSIASDQSINELVNNLFFGQKVNSDDKAVYQDLGILHLFVVSGLHLQILLTAVSLLFKNKKSRFLKIINSILMITFAVFNTFSIPIMRAILNRLINTSNSYLNLLLAACLTLIFFPLYILNLSFILTYCLFLVIILTSDIFKDKSKYVLPFSLVTVSNIILFWNIENYSINFNGIFSTFLLSPLVIILTIFVFIFVFASLFNYYFVIITDCLQLLNDLLKSTTEQLTNILNFENLPLNFLMISTLLIIIVYVTFYFKRQY